MSERTDVRTDITMAGAAGHAVRSELAALTRRLPAEQAALFRQAPCASGAARSLRTNSGDPREPREPRRRLGPDSPGSAAMTAADRAGGYDARCVPLLARLRLLARADAGAPLPPGAAGEVGQAAGAIVAEADAAVTAVADSGHRSAAVFLAVRQARLAAAADDVIAAAADGSAAALSRHVRRFESLTSALWTVQHAICAPAHRRPARRTSQDQLPESKPDCAPAPAGT